MGRRRRVKTISRKKRKARQNTPSGSRPMSVTMRFSIANLIITLALGIIVGIWVPMYINASNQQFENEMLTTLATIQHQNDFANLELRSTCSSEPACTNYEVINLGPGTAKNLTTTITISLRQGIWQALIKSMNQFNLNIIPSTLPILVRQAHSNIFTTSEEEPINDAWELSLDTLPAGAAFQFEINPNNALQKRWITLSQSINHNAANLPMANNSSPPASNVPRVAFDISSRCDNCTGMKRHLVIAIDPALSWFPDLTAQEVVTNTIEHYENLVVVDGAYWKAYNLLSADLQGPVAYDDFIWDPNYTLKKGCWTTGVMHMSQTDRLSWDVVVGLTQISCADTTPIAHFEWHFQVQNQKGLFVITSVGLYPTSAAN